MELSSDTCVSKRSVRVPLEGDPEMLGKGAELVGPQARYELACTGQGVCDMLGRPL